VIPGTNPANAVPILGVARPGDSRIPQLPVGHRDPLDRMEPWPYPRRRPIR
jgi:hypothetical protein